jgi:pyridoxine 5-phosphate synthase
MARLGVNIEAVAYLRSQSNLHLPDPLSAVGYAEIGGADGIVCPIHETLNPVTERDVRILKEAVKTHFNLQVPATEKMVSLAVNVAPDMITLLPSKTIKRTPGGGLDVAANMEAVAPLVKTIREKDIVVSLLVEPVIQQVKAADKTGADYVEIHLGRYAAAPGLNERTEILEAVTMQAIAASKLGLGVAAGRGINFQNVAEIAAIERIEEINIGQALIARALWVGLEAAVRDMVALVH